jgi:hypothetical protein
MTGGFWPNLTPKSLIQATISLTVLIVCLAVITDQRDSGAKNWAYGIVGSLSSSTRQCRPTRLPQPNNTS